MMDKNEPKEKEYRNEREALLGLAQQVEEKPKVVEVIDYADPQDPDTWKLL